MELKKELPNPNGDGLIKLDCERRDISFRGIKLDVLHYFYIGNDEVKYTSTECDEVNQMNMFIRFGEISTLKKLEKQVKTLPTIRNFLSPMLNLLELLKLSKVKFEIDGMEEIFNRNIETCYQSIERLRKPHKDDTFRDIDI